MSSKYFKVHYFSILPIVYSNFYTVILIFVTFFRFLREYEITYTCNKNNPDVECYSYSRSHSDPTLITNCSLVSETAKVRCIGVTYSFTTAITLTGGFLLLIPKIGFLLATGLYFKFLKRTLGCIIALMFINTCLFLLGGVLNYLYAFYFLLFDLPNELLFLLPKNQWDFIVISTFIFSIFMGCPFSFMLEQQLNKDEVKEFMAPDQDPTLPPASQNDNSNPGPTFDQPREDHISMTNQQPDNHGTIVMSQHNESPVNEDSKLIIKYELLLPFDVIVKLELLIKLFRSDNYFKIELC